MPVKHSLCYLVYGFAWVLVVALVVLMLVVFLSGLPFSLLFLLPGTYVIETSSGPSKHGRHMYFVESTTRVGFPCFNSGENTYHVQGREISKVNPLNLSKTET